MPLGHVLRHAAAGAIHDDRPGATRQHVLDAQGDRVLFADVSARTVDDGQSVGVGVLAEANVGAGLGDGREDAGEVFGGRLGRMRELAVRRFAEDGRLAAQRFQQPPSQGPARPVVGIQHNLEPPAADSRHVHRGQHGVEVADQRIGQRAAGAEAVVGGPRKLAAAIAGEDLLAQVGGNDSPLRRKTT